jgi:amino acid transporter
MTTTPTSTPDGSAESTETRPPTLTRNAVGIIGMVFIAVATAAPITAMTGNVPSIIGFGSGVHVPATYLIVTIVLAIFSVGYVTMARYVRTAGAFYGFVSKGLGSTLGIPSGLLALFAYLVFEAAIVGAFAFFAQQFFSEQLHITVPWLPIALAVTVLISIVAYFHITLTTKILGVLLLGEVAILGALAVAVLVRGGGPDGLVPGVLNPFTAFEGVPVPDATGAIAAGSVGFALFLAFWSWVGFESTAIYAEESRNPARNVPIATLVAVIGVGIFYVFVSWMVVSGNGLHHSVELAQSADPLQVFFEPTRTYLGGWAVTVFQVLTLTGSFACALAFHNCAARYLFVVGRDGIGTHSRLARVHPRHQSPYVASTTQSVTVLVIVTVLGLTGLDAYGIFVVVGLLGTLSILVVQALASFAVIAYFHNRRPEARNWWRTYLAPLIGGLAMVSTIGLLLTNRSAAAGPYASAWLYTATPYLVLTVFVGGLAAAFAIRRARPDRYGQLVALIDEDPLSD